MGNDNIAKKGGGFLVGAVEPADCFFPEDFTSEHLMIRETARKFTSREVLPVTPKIEKLDYAVIHGLLKKAGELGLLSVDLPEDLGGAGLDKVSATIVAEDLGPAGAFSVTLGAHCGIGTLPIVYYGNKAQQEKYLPKLFTGEWAASFALTEADSGSDAFALKTKAVLSPDGKHYLLNGTKQFITNAGFGQLFIIFAKINGEQNAAFIVERGFEGVSLGAEEKKMGIKGSSTTQIILQNAKVPVENLLGEPGKGAKIALNILNIGRLKLAAGCLGAAKDALARTLDYTAQRKQFGKTLNQFPLIQEKLSDMALRIFALEAACYRATGLIQARAEAVDKAAADRETQTMKCVEEHSIECSILKVLGSEVLDDTADEGIQCLGGYGYVEEYPLEKIYRDSRINRIFEGTNEINRLVITGVLLKKGQTGDLPLLEAVKAIQKEMAALPEAPAGSDAPLNAERRLVDNLKKAVLLIAGAAAQKCGKALEEEQEILARVADSIIALFALESAVLRAIKIASAQGAEKAAIPMAMARVLAQSTAESVGAKLRECAPSFSSGDELSVILAAIRRFVKTAPADTKTLRRAIARHIVGLNGAL